jgi:hypothetical protein
MVGTIHQTNQEALNEILNVYADDQGEILDCTYGKGVFWSGGDINYSPDVTMDIKTDYDVQVQADFNCMPFQKEKFSTVVFDPPYRMSGTGADYPLSSRYENEESNYKLVPKHYKNGMKEIFRVLKEKGLAIVKMQDQIVSGKRYYQTNKMLNWSSSFSRLLTEVHVVTGSRKQPEGRTKRNIRTEHSTFQVWKK